MSRGELRDAIDAALADEPPVGGEALAGWLAPTAESRVEQLPITAVRQPDWRPDVDEREPAYRALKASVRASGVLQPLLVRPAADGGYELVSGLRRLRAARATGQATVPAVIRALSDLEAMVGGWDGLRRTAVAADRPAELRMRLVAVGMAGGEADQLVASLSVLPAGATPAAETAATAASAEPVAAEAVTLAPPPAPAEPEDAAPSAVTPVAPPAHGRAVEAAEPVLFEAFAVPAQTGDPSGAAIEPAAAVAVEEDIPPEDASVMVAGIVAQELPLTDLPAAGVGEGAVAAAAAVGDQAADADGSARPDGAVDAGGAVDVGAGSAAAGGPAGPHDTAAQGEVPRTPSARALDPEATALGLVAGASVHAIVREPAADAGLPGESEAAALGFVPGTTWMRPAGQPPWEASPTGEAEAAALGLLHAAEGPATPAAHEAEAPSTEPDASPPGDAVAQGPVDTPAAQPAREEAEWPTVEVHDWGLPLDTAPRRDEGAADTAVAEQPEVPVEPAATVASVPEAVGATAPAVEAPADPAPTPMIVEAPPVVVAPSGVPPTVAPAAPEEPVTAETVAGRPRGLVRGVLADARTYATLGTFVLMWAIVFDLVAIILGVSSSRWLIGGGAAAALGLVMLVCAMAVPRRRYR